METIQCIHCIVYDCHTTTYLYVRQTVGRFVERYMSNWSSTGLVN